jgi:hypothetical protein
MAAISAYPMTGAIVRGDPLEIPVTLSVDGVAYDATGSNWRAQVRTTYNAALVVSFTCTAVGSTVTMAMTGDETALLKTGMMFDLEELDKASGDTIKTWWICTGLKVQDDVSRDDPGPLGALATMAKPNMAKTPVPKANSRV